MRRPSRSPSLTRRQDVMFWRGLVIQWRVVGALLIREIYSRFGLAALSSAGHDPRHFYCAVFAGDRLEPHRSDRILRGILYSRGGRRVPRFADVLCRLFLHGLVGRRDSPDHWRPERTHRLGAANLAALFLHVYDVFGVLLPCRLAAAAPSRRGALSALHTGIRNDPRRRVRDGGQN